MNCSTSSKNVLYKKICEGDYKAMRAEDKRNSSFTH